MENSSSVEQTHSLIPTITDCHAKRLGWTRTLVGGFSMYLSIPFWIIFHVTIATFLYQWIMRPLFGIKRLKWGDYVILDRHRIEGLVKIDKFNCLFCGYANGISTLINAELDHLNQLDGKSPLYKRVLATFSALVFIPFILVGDFLCVRLNYDMIIAPFLGMHSTTFSEIQKALIAEEWGKNFNPVGRFLFIYAKNVFRRIALLLEQIESSWCPLYHLEKRVGVVYPEHHKNFLQKHELDKMREVLSTRGSVSDRPPKDVSPLERASGWFTWD